MKYRYIIKLFFLFLFIGSTNIQAQQSGYTLAGWVKNIKGDPISNITISVLGSSQRPAVSDEQGNYSIEVSSGEVWLVFQPLEELVEKTIFLNNREVLNVYLIDEDLTNDYNIVIGEGQELLSRNVIAAHENISEEAMNFSSHSTFDQFFQTSLAGASVSNMSGMPGAGTTTFLRGVGSVNAGGQPLYVIDGIPVERTRYYYSLIDGYSYNPLSTIDPLDVSFMTVYKDPSYTSQYGHYGGNGVVELRSINPDKSETSIDFKYRAGITTEPKQKQQLESSGYKTLANELLFSSGMQQEDYEEAYPGLFYTLTDSLDYIPYSHNTNWQDEVFQNALTQNAYIAIKGGDAVAKYGISFGYLKKEGIIKSTSYDKFNTRFVGSFNVIDRVFMSINVNYVTSNANLRASALDNAKSPILSGLWKSPILSPFAYDENGNQLTTNAELDELGVSNVRALNTGFRALNSNSRFSISSKINTEITEKLHLIGLMGVNYNSTNESTFSPDKGMDLYLNSEAYNQSAGSSNTFLGMHVNTYLSYMTSFDSSDKNKLLVNIGTRTTRDKFQSDFAFARNTPSDDYTALNLGQPRLREIGGNTIDYSWLSFYGNANYNFKNRYLIDLKVSSDASSSMGKDAETSFSLGEVPFELYYSAGAAWRISNENFMKHSSSIEDFKLRVSYGVSGSDDFDILLSRPYYDTKQYNVLGVAVPGNYANSTLESEKRSTLNLGLDLALKGGRHQFSLDVYTSVTKDMLLFSQLPSFIGEDYFPANSGKMSNNGVEFSANSRLISRNNFAFDMGLRLGSYKNKVLELPEKLMEVSLPGAGAIVMTNGHAVNSFYGYKFKGVYASTEESNAAHLINNKGIPYKAGDAIFEDVSGPQGVPDGVINTYDKVILGSPNPDFMGALNFMFTYKNWRLNAVTQFAVGQEVYNYVRYQNEKMTHLNNQSISTLNRWSYEGQQTEMPRAVWNDPIGNNDFSSRWIEDGSYFRFKELTLSYSTEKRIIPKLRKIEVFITLTNVFTVTKYLGYDPEMSYSYNPLLQGVDYGLTPQSHSFMMGVNIGL